MFQRQLIDKLHTNYFQKKDVHTVQYTIVMKSLLL